MMHDIAPRVFHNEYHPHEPSGDATALFYSGSFTLIRKNDDGTFQTPKVKDFEGMGASFTYLFKIDDEEFFLVEYSDGRSLDKCVPEALKDEYTFEKSFYFRAAQPRYRAFAAITGLQLADWYKGHQICGQCGTRLVKDEKERMMRCPVCGRMYYPTICPGVIVAVTHKGKLLMSKYAGREYKNYALIAGFNESGESIEQTVHREVMEEVGLKVKNLRYYKSQPWPFSDTLLLGFFCELDGDDEAIKLEEDELAEAAFYPPEEVPDDHEHASLTAEMMTVFKQHYASQSANQSRVERA
ncbi:MAG: NAD(+) diphosphatase [Eubacteriales bacterium]|jgi:NAD+ diphosphatase